MDIGFDFDEDDGGSSSTVSGPPSPSHFDDDDVNFESNGDAAAAAPSPSATPDAERQILLLMLLAQVCSLHDPTPRTFTVHVLSLFERGILDRESVRFLFDLGLVPGDYQFGTALTNGPAGGQGNLLEWHGDASDDAPAHTPKQDGTSIVPYRTHVHTTVRSVEQTATASASPINSINIQTLDGVEVEASDFNTGDTSILLDEEMATPSSHPRQKSYMTNADRLRDILGDDLDDLEEVTREHRRKIVEKSKAAQFADRKRRELEVKSIRAHLERHESMVSAASDPVARAASSSAADSVDGSLRGGPPSNYPKQQQQQKPTNGAVGTSWSVASHPLSLSRYARDFSPIALLASGAFGDVYRARSNFDQTEYAIKRVCFEAAGYDNTAVQTVVREVQCLAKLDHPNCIRYYTSWLEPSWMTGGGEEVEIDRVGTAEERGRLLEGVKKLVLLEDGDAGDGSTGNVKIGGWKGKEDTFGTLEKDLRQMDISTPQARSRSRKRYGKDIDTGFSFESYSNGGPGAADDWDQLDSYYTYGSDGVDLSNCSSYSEWSDENISGRRRPIERDFSKGGDNNTTGNSSAQTSIPSIEGGERSGNKQAGSIKNQKTTFQTPPRRDQATRENRRDTEYKYRICLFVQMQLCRPSTLADWIQARNKSYRHGGGTSSDAVPMKNLPWVEPAFRIFHQIVCGLAHIHSRSIIHRDLKPANVFASLDEEGGIPIFKIGDFGLSKMLLDANGGHAFESEASKKEHHRQKQKQRGKDGAKESRSDDLSQGTILALPSEAHTVGVGTASYASPEQIGHSNYDSAADIFSLGLILLELFSTFDSLHERASIFAACRKGILPHCLVNEFPNVAELVLACTDGNPSNRPAADIVRSVIEKCLQKYDASPASDIAAQKRLDSYHVEIKQLRGKLKAKDQEINDLRELLAEKDLMIARLSHSSKE